MPGAKSQGNVRSLNPCLHQRLLMRALLLLDMSQKGQVQPHALGGVLYPEKCFQRLILLHLFCKASGPLLDHPTLRWKNSSLTSSRSLSLLLGLGLGLGSSWVNHCLLLVSVPAAQGELETLHSLVGPHGHIPLGWVWDTWSRVPGRPVPQQSRVWSITAPKTGHLYGGS